MAPPPDEESAQPLLHSTSTSNTATVPKGVETELSRWKNSYFSSRGRIRTFLSSRPQHYIVLALVTFDLLGIFADIIITLSLCQGDIQGKKWAGIRNGLGIAGLAFSSMFMAELLLSVWAFGFRYFNSKFHCFDASVILAGFIIDVLLHGVLEEVASLVVVLRLWRFLKIVEEFSVGAEEQMDGLNLRIEQLEMENQELKRELSKRKGVDRDTDGRSL